MLRFKNFRFISVMLLLLKNSRLLVSFPFRALHVSDNMNSIAQIKKSCQYIYFKSGYTMRHRRAPWGPERKRLAGLPDRPGQQNALGHTVASLLLRPRRLRKPRPSEGFAGPAGQVSRQKLIDTILTMEKAGLGAGLLRSRFFGRYCIIFTNAFIIIY